MITNIALENGTNLVYSYDDLDRLLSDYSWGSLRAYSYDAAGNRIQMTRDGINVSYQYANNCNRLTGWTATSTNDFASQRSLNISGYSSEAIGTNP